MATNGFTVTPTSGHSGTTAITVSASSLTSNSERGVWINITAGTLTKQVLAWQDTAKHHLDVTPPRVYLPSTGGSATFQIDSDENWSLTNQTTWATFSQLSGSSTTVTVSAGINRSVDTRSAMFMINTPNMTGSVYVEQPSAAALNVNPNPVYADSGASTTYMAITTNSGWTISVLPEWVTASSMSGTGNSTIVLYCTSYTGEGTRTGTITLNYGDGSAYQVGIVQYGKYWLTVEPDSFSFNKESGSTSFTLTSDCNWEISSSYATSISPASGSGSTTINFSYPENTATAATAGSITINYGRTTLDSTLTIPITQEGRKFIEATPTAITFSYQGGSSNVTVKSNVPWVAGRSGGWINISPSAGTSGQTTVAISADTNTGGRTGQVTFHDSEYWAVDVVDITQSMALGVNPTGLTFGPSAGEVKTFEVLGSDEFNYENHLRSHFEMSVSGRVFTVSAVTGNDYTDTDYNGGTITLTGRTSGIVISVPIVQEYAKNSIVIEDNLQIPYGGKVVNMVVNSNYQDNITIHPYGIYEYTYTGTTGQTIPVYIENGTSLSADSATTIYVYVDEYHSYPINVTLKADPDYDYRHYYAYWDSTGDYGYTLSYDHPVKPYCYDTIPNFVVEGLTSIGISSSSPWISATYDEHIYNYGYGTCELSSTDREGFITVTGLTSDNRVLTRTLYCKQVASGQTYTVTCVIKGWGSGDVQMGNGYYLTDIKVNGTSIGAVEDYVFNNSIDNTVVYYFSNPILSYSFAHTRNLKSITVDSGFKEVRHLGMPDDYSTRVLQNITLPNGLEILNFRSNTSSNSYTALTTTTIPSSVVYIANTAASKPVYDNRQIYYGYPLPLPLISGTVYNETSTWRGGEIEIPNNYGITDIIIRTSTFVKIYNTVTGITADSNVTIQIYNSSDQLVSLILGSDEKCVGHLDLPSLITCNGTTAPAVSNVTIPATGTFSYPAGADYSYWLSILPEGWTITTH